MKIQKYLSQQGICSRRKGEALIVEGRIKVNGQMAKLGDRIDVGKDTITLDGKSLKQERKRSYYILLNKPRGYVSTTDDPQGRKTVLDLVSDIDARLYPVGRLDYETEGLLILTNDGDLTYQLTHPKHHVGKTYKARVSGAVPYEALEVLKEGVLIDEHYRVKASEATLIERDKESSLVEITIFEGRNRQVRKMFEEIGFPVIRLTRTKIDKITIKDLKRGQYRHLRKTEVDRLKNISKIKGQ